MKIKLQQED